MNNNIEINQNLNLLKLLSENDEKLVIITQDRRINLMQITKISKGKSRQVYDEFQILHQLQTIICIPRTRNNGYNSQKKFYFTSDYYEYSLANLLKRVTILSQQSVLSIGIIILKILEEIHQLGIIYFNLNTENVKLKLDEISLQNIIKIVGFKYSLTKYSNRVKYTNTKNLEFQPISFHKKVYPKFIDDLESLGYLMLKLRLGNLPWENTSEKDMLLQKQKFFDEIDQIEKIPKCFIQYFQYIKIYSLFPNYHQLRQLLMKNLQQCQSQKMEVKELRYLPQISEVENENISEKYTHQFNESLNLFSSNFTSSCFDDFEQDLTVEEKISLLSENTGKFKLLQDL